MRKDEDVFTIYGPKAEVIGTAKTITEALEKMKEIDKNIKPRMDRT